MDKNTFLNFEVKGFAREVIEFIDDSPSIYHVVKNCSVILDENGFERLEPNKSWNLKLGGRYYLKKLAQQLLRSQYQIRLIYQKDLKFLQLIQIVLA